MEKKLNPAFAKVGMDKDTHPTMLDESKYTHAKNANVENESGNFLSLTTEQSNILASKFKEGFKVIHANNDINSNNTYFFLVNPETGVGEFGVIEGNQLTPDLQDTPNECGNCYNLSEPLENQEQTELQTYVTLISDECKEDKTEGFNFDITKPIKFSVIKNEKLGTTIYFAVEGSPARYVNIDRIQDYFTQVVSCGDDITLDCPDFRKMLIQKNHKIPQLSVSSIELGGNLDRGSYEFAVALCDVNGNQMSEYHSLKQPVNIFDKNDTILEQPELFNPTNFSIRLEVDNLDDQYTHYKIAVVKATSTERYFIAGVYPISNKVVLVSTTDGLKETTLEEITRPFVFLEETKGLVSANNYLYQFGLKQKTDLNLQPVVNFLGEFLQWQTHVAKEGLYENGVLASKYKGYNRDEVVPVGIRFFLDGGQVTPNYPLIGRQLIKNVEGRLDDDEIVDTIDSQSLNANTTACIDVERDKRWQIYNTASVDDGFCDGDITTIEVEETITRACEIEDVAVVSSGSVSLEVDEIFVSILDYINDNRDNCLDTLPSDICTALNADYSANICETLFDDIDCTEQSLVDGTELIEAYEVENEVITRIQKDFPADYLKIVPPSLCAVYQTDTDGSYLKDEEFKNNYGFSKIYFREGNFINEECPYAEDISIVSNPTAPSVASGYFNYLGSEDISDLLTSKNAYATFTDFNAKIHKKSLWYRLDVSENSFILDITKQSDSKGSDSFDSLSQNTRLSIFKNCTSSTAIYSTLVDMDLGKQIQFIKNGADLTLKDDENPPITLVGGWSSTQYYIVLESKLIEKIVNIAPTFAEPIYKLRYVIAPTKGCFGLSKRPEEDKRVDVTWDSIKFKKTASYSATCIFEQPVVGACEAVPFKKGDFAYWESLEKYPDNSELYDSTTIEITPDDFSSLELRAKFEEKFTNGISSGKYIWKQDELKEVTDFTCRNIRHFKMPDNKVAPYITSTTVVPFGDSLIYPLGLTINEQVIVDFLNIAEKNNLITKKQRSLIKGYELVRADLRTDRSIIASGLLFDMRKYKDEDANRELIYSNYPYNSYRDDIFNLDKLGQPITHSGWGQNNSLYTFHSPETDFKSPTLPTELSIQGYIQGTAKINFDKVKDHGEWVMLTGKAKDTAGLLATLEVAAEITIQAMQAYSNSQVWAVFGWVGGASLGVPAKVASATIAVIQSTTAAVFKWAQYRYEWLKIFRDLGTPHNFAYYQFGVGKYSFLNLEQSEGNSLRGINSAKYLKEGMYETTNPVTAKSVQINNLQRERSVFLDLGDYSITYPPIYKNYDKGSLTYLGENNLKQTGRSSDIFKNVASPYVALKNFIPNQHGTINSIQWLGAGYVGDLENPKTSCLSIFGGDTYITRHYVKRKMPQFLENAMGLAPRTPFNYFQYNNIGKNPRFYVSYNLDKDLNRNGKFLPDIEDDYKFDNSKNIRNYRVPPSKFYLFHYGVNSFLAESRVNTDLRYAKTNPEQNFYPQVGDLGDWTQENRVTIKQHERFYYNNIYSKENIFLRSRSLPVDYSKKIAEKRSNQPNGILPSLPDNSENSTFDPWLIYRPLDLFEFPTEYGQLKSISQLENEALLARFENTNVVYNKVDYTNDDGRGNTNPFLGGSSVFQRRSSSFANAEIGFGGTQNYTSVSCEAGHFHVDAKRGQIIQVMPGGGGSEEISSVIQGKPSGMRNWFKEHLPFKILKHFKDVDVDNNYNGIGLSMVWDSRYRRLLITKKDYKPLSDCVTYEDGNFYNSCYTPNCDKDNLVVNGGFDSNLDGWFSQYPVEESFSWNDGKAWFADANDQNPTISQDILQVGKTYKIRFDLYINPNCSVPKYVKVKAGNTESSLITTTGQSSVDLILTCTGSTLFGIEMAFACGSYGEYTNNTISIDNVCVMEVDNKEKIDMTDTRYFKDVGWTIAFYPYLGAWGSFYDYKPNYYISHQDYFQSGINSVNRDNGLWSHSLTNKSHLVFYGKKFDFQVEYPVKSDNAVKKLNNIELWTEAVRYHNEYDFAFTPLLTFNKVMVHNHVVCSGNLNLVPQKNNLAYNKNYPKTNADNTQDILITNKDNFRWSFDYMFNRVKSNVNNAPFINYDENQIEKFVNNQAVSFKGKPILDRLEGDYFLTRLSYDKDSRYRLTFKFGLNESDI